MSDGGKGSKPRPYSVSREQFASNWDTVFSKNRPDNTGVENNEYYDILTTEDCFEYEDKITRYNEETQTVKTLPR